MFRSLRLRLLGGFLLVAFVAVGVVAVIAGQATRGQFRGYLDQRVEQGQSRYEQMLGRYYADQGNWEGVQLLVERMGEISGDQVVLVDTNGTVVADSARDLLGKQADRGWVGGPIPVMKPGPARRPGPGRGPGQAADPEALAGVIFVNPLAAQNIDKSFFDAVNRWLLVAALSAGALALLLTLAISRSIFGPIQALTVAARRMEGGDLISRVSVKSKDEIGTLAHAFNAMAASLAKNEQLRRNIVSDVAHELRTPLTNVRGYLEAMRDGVLEPDRKTIDIVSSEAELLSRLVNDLQDLALAEAGQLRLAPQPVSLNEIVARAVEAIRPQTEAKELRLEANLAADLPLASADAERIGQVLRNLLNNAVVHTAPNGTIAVSTRRAEDFLEVSVVDTGVGIAPEDLPFVFERFYRGDRSRSRATGGSGLGLTIAKRIVEAHGGRIEVKSQVGSGTTFMFAVPVRPSSICAGTSGNV